MQLTALASSHSSSCHHRHFPPSLLGTAFANHDTPVTKKPTEFMKMFLLISSSLRLVCLLYFQIPAIFFVIAICHFCKRSKHVSFHLVRRCVCSHAHVAEDSVVVKQMCDDSSHQGPVIWASEPHVSLPSTCTGHFISSSSFSSVFYFY